MLLGDGSDMSIDKEKERLKEAWAAELEKIRQCGHDVQEEIMDTFLDSELEQPFSQPIYWMKLKKLQRIVRDKGL